MSPEQVLAKAQHLDRMIGAAVDQARNLLVGLEAKVNTVRAGQYNGRTGAVDGVMSTNDGLGVLVMITSRSPGATGTRGRPPYLNSACATRTYWPLDAIEFTGKRLFEHPKP